MKEFLKKYFTPLPFLLLLLYVFFMYNAQATLLPTVIHSVSMYTMIAATLIYYFFKSKLTFTYFTGWYLVFVFISVVSSTFYLQSDETTIYTLVVSLIISYCFIQNITDADKIIALANAFIFSAIIMAIQIWASGQLDYLVMASSQSHDRLGGEITGNANIFSALFMYAGVFAAWLCVYSKNKKSMLAYALLLGIILFIMVISGGRKTIIAVVTTLALFFFLKKNSLGRNNYVRNTLIALSSIGIIFYAIFNIPLLYDLIGERFEGLFEMFQGKEAKVSGDDMRSKIFSLAYQGWLEAPLFGHGIDSFKFYNVSETGHFYYAHNNYVELLYDFGIIGFIAYYWIFIYIYNHLRRLPLNLYTFKVLGYGLFFELLVYDLGGISYCTVGSIILLAIAYSISQTE